METKDIYVFAQQTDSVFENVVFELLSEEIGRAHV